jgi:hypothetical protein
MGMPREINRVGMMGQEEVYATLYPDSTSSLTCIIGEQNHTMSVRQDYLQ